MKTKICDNCKGEGYIDIASTVFPEENESVLCEMCQGAGVLELMPF